MDIGFLIFMIMEMHFFGFKTEKLIKRVIAKPFGGSFQTQQEAAEDLYGKQLQIFFTNDDLENVLKEANPYYSKDIIDRVWNLVQYQLKTYNREQQDIEKENLNKKVDKNLL